MADPLLIVVGMRGYAVVVDDAAGAAIVRRSTRTGVSESARFTFAEFGRRHAVSAAVWTAIDLTNTATEEVRHVE